MAKKINSNFWQKKSSDKFFDVQCELRTTVAHPYILNKIKSRFDLKVLDYGCGEGDLSIKLADSGNDIIAVDISEKSIKEAKKRYIGKKNLNFLLLEEMDPHIQYDVIILSFVLVTVKTQQLALKLLKNISHLLKSNGEVYFIDTHPCFRDKIFSTARTKFNYVEYSKNYIPFRVELSDCNDETKYVVFEDYHKSLSEIFSIFLKNNFLIKNLDEIYDKINDNMIDSVKFKYNSDIPIYLYLELTLLENNKV